MSRASVRVERGNNEAVFPVVDDVAHRRERIERHGNAAERRRFDQNQSEAFVGARQAENRRLAVIRFGILKTLETHALQTERSRKLLQRRQIIPVADEAQRPRRETLLQLCPNAQEIIRAFLGIAHSSDEEQLFFLLRKIGLLARAHAHIADCRDPVPPHLRFRQMRLQHRAQSVRKHDRARAMFAVEAILSLLPLPLRPNVPQPRQPGILLAITEHVRIRHRVKHGDHGNAELRRLARERELPARAALKNHDVDALLAERLFKKSAVFFRVPRLLPRKNFLRKFRRNVVLRSPYENPHRVPATRQFARKQLRRLLDPAAANFRKSRSCQKQDVHFFTVRISLFSRINVALSLIRCCSSYAYTGTELTADAQSKILFRMIFAELKFKSQFFPLRIILV